MKNPEFVYVIWINLNGVVGVYQNKRDPQNRVGPKLYLPWKKPKGAPSLPGPGVALRGEGGDRYRLLVYRTRKEAEATMKALKVFASIAKGAMTDVLAVRVCEGSSPEGKKEKLRVR